MGEEKKEVEKKEVEEKGESKEDVGDQNKDEEKKKNGSEGEGEAAPAPLEIVLKVDMHCQACARKMARALKGLKGVEDVNTDLKSGKVVVKAGKSADPVKVCERLRHKSGRKVQLISPIPQPPKSDQETDEQKTKEEAKPAEDKKEEPSAPITVVLSVPMHCEACAQVLQKRVRKIKGVESVETDVSNDKVTVKGIFEPQKLVDNVKKRTRKQAWIVKDEEEKKEEGKEKQEEGGDQNNKLADASDHEKKLEEEDIDRDGKGDDDKNKTTDIIKRSEYWPSTSKYYSMEYAYAPQIFSDENPNACSVM